MIFIFDVYFKINLIQNFSTKTNFTFWHILLKEAQPRIFKDKNISASFINPSSKSSKSKGRDEKRFLLSTEKNAAFDVNHPALFYNQHWQNKIYVFLDSHSKSKSRTVQLTLLFKFFKYLLKKEHLNFWKKIFKFLFLLFWIAFMFHIEDYT